MPSTRDLRQSDTAKPAGGIAPAVDFRQLPGNPEAIENARRACLENGFLYLNNAMPGDGTLAAALQQMQRFFALPDHDSRKAAVRASASNRRGWTPLFGEPAYQPGTIAHVESFDIGRPGNSANAWPDLPDFRADVRALWHRLENVGQVVLDSLALAAGVALHTFSERCNSLELSTMRLLHYPANDKPDVAKNVGIAAHTDFECMTLIMQTAAGLELRNTGGSWHDAPASGDQMVVLLGDMLEHWTNGHFQATGHRVRNTGEERYSIVFFFAVNDDELITALPGFVSEEDPVRYEPVSQREHLEREVHAAERYRDEN